MTDRSAPFFTVRAKPPKSARSYTKSPQLVSAERALQAQVVVASDLAARASAGQLTKTSPEVVAATAKQDALTKAYQVAKAGDSKNGPPQAPSASDVDITLRILSFEYEEDEKKIDKLTLTIDNRDLSAFDSDLLSQGTTLFVSWGYAGDMAPTREVVIRSVKGALTLKVEGQGKSVLMNRLGKTRAFENKKRSEVVKQIAEENGYGAEVQFIDDTDVVQAHVAQAGLTDAAFIKRLATIEGFEFYVDHQGFHWKSRKLNVKPLRVLQYMLPPDVGDILSFDVENDLTAKPGKVTVKGRDPLKKEEINVAADNAGTKRTALAGVIKAVDLQTGVREKHVVNASEAVMPSSAVSAPAAKREAEGAYKRAQLASVKLSGSLVGDPTFAAKSVVEVRGLGKRLSGKYYVTTVTHKIDGSGYLMNFKARTDGENKRTGPKAATGASQNKETANTDKGLKVEKTVNLQNGTSVKRWVPG